MEGEHILVVAPPIDFFPVSAKLYASEIDDGADGRMFTGNPFGIYESERASGYRERDLRVKDVFCGIAQIDGEANRPSRILRVCSSGKKMERKKGEEDPKQNAVAHERVLQKKR
jgi:hypothetical protein